MGCADGAGSQPDGREDAERLIICADRLAAGGALEDGADQFASVVNGKLTLDRTGVGR
jgi:hypothetical protein